MIFSGQNLAKNAKIISVHDVLEPLKQGLLASRDVIISCQNCGSKLQNVFTLGDGCWLPIYLPPAAIDTAAAALTLNLSNAMEEATSKGCTVQEADVARFTRAQLQAMAKVTGNPCSLRKFNQPPTPPIPKQSEAVPPGRRDGHAAHARRAACPRGPESPLQASGHPDRHADAGSARTTAQPHARTQCCSWDGEPQLEHYQQMAASKLSPSAATSRAVAAQRRHFSIESKRAVQASPLTSWGRPLMC